jgi:RNA polymerase sigma factor (sigma-70 family)
MRDPNDIPEGSAATLTGAALEKHAQTLMRYLLRRVRHNVDTPDLSQEIFERFLRKKHRPEVIRNPMAYLLGIASHVLSERYFEERTNPVTFDSGLVEQFCEHEKPGLDTEIAETAGIQKDLAAALAKLPRNHAAALMLVEGEGMSYKEAARATGLAPNTISMYVMQARASLKKSLVDYWREKDAQS